MTKKVRAKVDWKSIGRKIASSHKLNKELENVCKRKKSKAKLSRQSGWVDHSPRLGKRIHGL